MAVQGILDIEDRIVRTHLARKLAMMPSRVTNIRPPCKSAFPTCSIDRWAHQALADDPQIERDAKRLEATLKIDTEVLCLKQCRR